MESYLFECQCALFMVDITSTDSFNLIKDLIVKIKKVINKVNNIKNYDNSINKNNLKKLLIINKSDLETERKILQEEISSFLNNNTSYELIDLSLKTENGIKSLNNKLVEAFKVKQDSNLPCEQIYEESESYNDPQLALSIKTKTTINCVLIGETEVGKSSFLLRYFKNEFSEVFLTTIGLDKETKVIKIKNDVYRFTLWDTAGQERFRSIPPKYYQNADGIFFLFDINDRKSINNVSDWISDIKKYVKKKTRKNIFLVGNKIDLKRNVTKEEAIRLADEHGMKYFEMSCKTNMNINEIVNRMINNCYPTIEDSIGGKLDKKKNKKKKGNCCG